MKHYEAIIIGGGGGLKLRPISEFGKIAVIEKEDLGGTCLNRGCIPSKMLIHPAELMDEIQEASRFHISAGKAHVDFAKLVEETTAGVSKSSQNIAKAYDANPNIDFYHGEGRFVEDKVVEVNGEKLTAERIFIATGSRPRIPQIDGLEGTPFMTSREALRNAELPKRMIVIGGGYIALELGYFYASMGTQVEFLIRSDILKNEDREIATEFRRAFEEKHALHFEVSPKRVTHDGSVFTVETSDGTFEAEALFVAAGIVPNSDQLGLENTTIKRNAAGFIEVDEYLSTNVPGVYALGDVIGNYFFRHSVNYEGEYLMRVLYTDPSDEAIAYPPMPHAVFSNPQIAGVGKTEEELKAEGVDYFVGLNKYEDSAMGGNVLKSKHGLVKLLFERSSQRLMGAHIVGREAATMMHMLIAFMNMNATLSDLLNTIYIHPAFPEVIRNAARKAKKNA